MSQKYLSHNSANRIVTKFKTDLAEKVDLSGANLSGELKAPSIRMGSNPVDDSANIFEIGNGTSSSSKSNAFSVDNTGNIVASGDIQDSNGNTFDSVNRKLGSVYTPKGNIRFEDLPTPSASNLGWVFNIVKHVPERVALLLNGDSLSNRISYLVDEYHAVSESHGPTEIIKSDTLKSDLTLTNKNFISDNSSEYPIYAWCENGILYYYTEADKIKANDELCFSIPSSPDAMKNVRRIDLVKGLDTSDTTYMGQLFGGLQSLESIDLSSFDTSNVTSMSRMFTNCRSLTSLDLSSFDTSNVEYMTDMFRLCSNLKTILVSEKFTTSKLPKPISYMFFESPSLVGGNGTRYNSDHAGSEYARIDTASTPGYFTLKSIP